MGQRLKTAALGALLALASPVHADAPLARPTHGVDLAGIDVEPADDAPSFVVRRPVPFDIVLSTPSRTLYASPAGTGDGASRLRPASLTDLLGAAEPGDRIVLLAGDYPSATASLRGTADAPIHLLAERSAVSAAGETYAVATDGVARFKDASLTLSRSSHVIVEGISFERGAGNGSGARLTSGAFVRFARNHFANQAGHGILVSDDNLLGRADIHHVIVDGNVFRNAAAEPEAGGIGVCRTDYGLRVHGTRDLLVRSNGFEGCFNHAISLKENVHRADLSANAFTGCGFVCIEAGQEPDTTYGTRTVDRTSSDIRIAGNAFTGLVDPVVGVFVRNAGRVQIEDNRFLDIEEPLRVADNDRNAKSAERLSFYGLHGRRRAEPGSMMTHAGQSNTDVLFENNRIAGTEAQIILAGRGTADDAVILRNNRGAAENLLICVRSFIRNAAPFNAWVPSAIATERYPRLFVDDPTGYTFQNGSCLGRDLTHDCEASGHCTGYNDPYPASSD